MDKMKQQIGNDIRTCKALFNESNNPLQLELDKYLHSLNNNELNLANMLECLPDNSIYSLLSFNVNSFETQHYRLSFVSKHLNYGLVNLIQDIKSKVKCLEKMHHSITEYVIRDSTKIGFTENIAWKTMVYEVARIKKERDKKAQIEMQNHITNVEQQASQAILQAQQQATQVAQQVPYKTDDLMNMS
jgi:hypothetical protein